jgi:exportin-5
MPTQETPLTQEQAAIEVFQAIYSRHHLHDDDFGELVWPMFAPDNVTLLREVYNWSIADLNVNDLDDQKYTLCKKMSEVSTFVTPPPGS